MRARFRFLALAVLLGCGTDDTRITTGVDLQVDCTAIEATLL